MQSEKNKTLEAEIARLDDLGLDELRALCRHILGDTPSHHGPALLRRRLAYELQVRVHGDLPVEVRDRLKRLHKAFKANPAYTPSPGRGVKAGTVLTRTWRGTTHQVQATDHGFEYQGEHFGSLSEVARRITGTRWSGPVFFGLQARAEADQ
jgi:DUF2924 family protein